MNEKVQIGRLAMRREGNIWKAYYASQPGDPKEYKHFLGSIAMAAIERNPELKDQFMDMMKSIVADVLEDVIGQRPTWGNWEKAPGDERIQ